MQLSPAPPRHGATPVASPLALFSIFHLNLAFSSIEEERRPVVVERCYWPLLRLATELDLPFGIEATGWTLEQVERIDPAWVAELRRLLANGRCELVGSGYAQLIGPLVPPAANRANLRLGQETYERLLGVRPTVALVNEQAYAPGLVAHYLDAGYEAIAMEWDNASRWHRDWDAEWRYLPQRALGHDGRSIPLLWNASIPFQKVQRLAHGELEEDELVDYLAERVATTPRALALYGNDVEVFDFRPGRFVTEAGVVDGEWDRLAALYARLDADPRFRLVAPSEALALDHPDAGHALALESPEQPVPVKKQGKYNVTRWAASGRDDVAVNAACRRIHDRLLAEGGSDDEWRELCVLWASDHRTHITERRWRGFRAHLDAAAPATAAPTAAPASGPAPLVRREGRYLTLESDVARVRLNLRRGLAIDALWLGDLDGEPLAGTLPHGYFDDIALGADFYTGHLVLEMPGRGKITDLAATEPVLTEDGGRVVVAATMPTPLGPLRKEIALTAGAARLEVSFGFDWTSLPACSLRLGHLTLNPRAFDPRTLAYRTANGGDAPDRHPLFGRDVDHGAPVSFLVSASTAVGATDGRIELGDAARRIAVEFDPATAALVGMVTHRPVDDSFFCRVALSLRELDETCRETEAAPPPVRLAYTL